ncbi:MAG TPA: hypothetical protein VG637_03510 [Actinomycetes bacterium]|nr:hypothetical protein [Actinomycetes bacterium]
MQHPSRPTEPRQEVVELAAGLVPGLAARAAGYDDADAFCHEDFDELVAAGYTAITVPADLGGSGRRPGRGRSPPSRRGRPGR